MNKNVEKQFQQIAQRATSDAADVKCSKEDYKEGLEMIMSDLEVNLDVVNEELAAEEAGE